MPRRTFSRLPAERREQILETAGKEFATHGYDGASLNHILQAAGVSKGAAYYYFDDKADLYLSVVQHYWDRVLGSAIPELDKLTAASFWDELAAVYRATFACCIERPWILELARSVWKLSPRARSAGPLASIFELMREWFRVVLEKGRSLGVIRVDLPDDLVLAVMMALDEGIGSWLLAHWAELENPPEEALRIHLQTLEMMRRMLQPGSSNASQ